MKTTITSRHFKASEKLTGYATTEVERLNKFFPGIVDCEVILSYDVHQNKTAEASLNVPGDTIVASETSEDFYKSIDQMVGKLEVQIRRYKDKLKKKH